MYFPFRLKNYTVTKKGNGCMVNFESQFGETIAFYCENALLDRCKKLYEPGQVYRIDVIPGKGQYGLELKLKLEGLTSVDALF